MSSVKILTENLQEKISTINNELANFSPSGEETSSKVWGARMRLAGAIEDAQVVLQKGDIAAVHIEDARRALDDASSRWATAVLEEKVTGWLDTAVKNTQRNMVQEQRESDVMAATKLRDILDKQNKELETLIKLAALRNLPAGAEVEMTTMNKGGMRKCPLRKRKTRGRNTRRCRKSRTPASRKLAARKLASGKLAARKKRRRSTKKRSG